MTQLPLFLNLGHTEFIFGALSFGILPIILMIYCLVDIIRGTFKDDLTKLLFALMVIFMPFIGSIVYLIIRKDQKIV